MLVLLAHVLYDNVAEVDISDVGIAFLVQLGPDVRQAAAQNHDLVLLVIVEAAFDDLLQLSVIQVPLLLEAFSLAGLVALLEQLAAVASVPVGLARVVWVLLRQEYVILPRGLLDLLL